MPLIACSMRMRIDDEISRFFAFSSTLRVRPLGFFFGCNVLIAEDLGISNMVQNRHLSKSISDAAWATFFDWCASMVSERDGLHFHKVNPKYTSQDCSCCGQRSAKKLSLAIWTFSCQFCGFSLDSDHNAACNILYRAAVVPSWRTLGYQLL